MNKGLVSTLLVLTTAFGIGGVSYASIVKNSHYSKEQYEQNYQDGYEAGCGESVVLKKQLQIELEEIKKLTAEKSALESMKNDYKEKYEAGLITINEYESNVSSLNNRISKLIQDLEYCQEQLAQAGVSDTYIVVFKVDNESYDSQIISPDNTTLTVPSKPSKEHYTFLGWSKDGSTIIENLSAETITENTTYVAIFEANTYSLFFNDGVNITKIDYTYGTTLQLPEEPSINGKRFLGWSNDNKNIIDFSNYEIVGDETFVAMYEISDYVFTSDMLTRKDSFYFGYDESLESTILSNNEMQTVITSNNFDLNYAISYSFTVHALEDSGYSAWSKEYTGTFESSERTGIHTFTENTTVHDSLGNYLILETRISFAVDNDGSINIYIRFDVIDRPIEIEGVFDHPCVYPDEFTIESITLSKK